MYMAPGNEEILSAEIEQIKKRMGADLFILTHHYQRPEIVRTGHAKGDSYALSLHASRQTEARYIVFCGVHFMAESAKILSRKGQRVFMPDVYAGCPMADMAEASDLEHALETIKSFVPEGEKAIPVSYINTTAEIKAVTGSQGGIVCTSSNASAAFRRVLSEGARILFVPDEHLGRNTANRLNIDRIKVCVWDPTLQHGGLTDRQIRESLVFLWKGYCHVHTWFMPQHIRTAREKYPGCIIIVHPECSEEVVALADDAGSTEYILQSVKKAKPGTDIVIGTEINMVMRLSMEFPDKNIRELGRSLCPNMYKITLSKLKNLLENFDQSHEITVDENTAAEARIALQRMLEL
jgi:quinolinate synthase